MLVPVDPTAPAGAIPIEPSPRAGYGPTLIYLFADEHRSPLYVGVTSRPHDRFVAHRRDASWWALARYVGVGWHDSMWDALREERELIVELRPRFNKRSMPRTP